MRFAILFCAALSLAACKTDQAADDRPVIAAAVAGPQFTSAQFDCGPRPLPPNLAATDPAIRRSTALRYEDALGTWGQHCSNMLIGRRDDLAGAGLIMPTPPALRGSVR